MDHSQIPVTVQPGTTVTVQQQGNFQMSMTTNPLSPRGIPRAWSTTLFQCFDDIPICLCGFFLGPCHQCCLAQEMGENCCVPMCVPGPLITMRALHRGRHNVQGSLMNDCLSSVICGWCTQCQLAREVQAIKNGRVQP